MEAFDYTTIENQEAWLNNEGIDFCPGDLFRVRKEIGAVYVDETKGSGIIIPKMSLVYYVTENKDTCAVIRYKGNDVKISLNSLNNKLFFLCNGEISTKRANSGMFDEFNRLIKTEEERQAYLKRVS